MSHLPTVDYRAFASGDASRRDEFCRAFGEGLRDFGFGVVAHHPIGAERIARAFALTERLFALPEAEKRGHVVPESVGNRGYVPFGGERAVGARVADLKEYWHVGRDEPDSGLLPNAWPASLPELRAELVALHRDFEETARVLLRAVALYLGLPEEHLAAMTVGGDSVLRLIHYPPVPDDAPVGAVRAAAHEDVNLITLLAEGTTGGLEVLTTDGAWLPVRSLDGQLVINAGDMLQRVTHGLVRSTTHRVVNPSGVNRSRFSIPFFTHPRHDVMLAPMAPPAGWRGPELASVRAGDFLAERLHAIKA
jgi:isopenicillin N synthase-like dioxygenase